MGKKAVSCKFNIDTPVWKSNLRMRTIFLDCALMEAEVAQNIYESCKLEWGVYNAPFENSLRVLRFDIFYKKALAY